MTPTRPNALIIGGGQAGGWIAKTLRSEGYMGSVTLLGDERHAPYERPPLSKSVLRSDEAIGETVVLTADQARELDVTLALGKRIVSIDRAERTVTSEDGDVIDYDMLFLATGSRPRLPDWMTDDERVHVLRTLDDAARLRAGLQSTRRLLVVGGGWIGLETAATARALGVDVVVVEMAGRLCKRSVPAPVSHWLQALHERNGVSVMLNARVAAVRVEDDVVRVELADGQQLSGDRLVVGIGNIPNTEIAEAAGLAVANGIVVDPVGRTSDPHIFAAGDVASFPCGFAGCSVRRESWSNAQNQAIAAAKAALGHAVAYDDLPWLWSDQYGVNIQIAGLPERAARMVFKAGPTEDAGCWLALDESDAPIGAIGAADPRGFRPMRKALQNKDMVAIDGWVDIPFD